jgi:hypothetical protein
MFDTIRFKFSILKDNGCITASGSIFHQLLAATRRRRKITKPLTLSAPISINQTTLNVRAPFNESGNFERARPFQSTRQL